MTRRSYWTLCQRKWRNVSTCHVPPSKRQAEVVPMSVCSSTGNTDTVKSCSHIFGGSTVKKLATQENVSPDHIFFNLKKRSSQTYLPNRVLLWCLESHPHTLLFPTCPTQLHCRLNHENTSAPKFTCFASQASFVLISKMGAFASTVLLLPITVWTVDRESPRFFAISARFRFESWFTAMKS